MDDAFDRFDHPAWATAVATGVGYLLIVGVVFAVLFLVPFLLW